MSSRIHHTTKAVAKPLRLPDKTRAMLLELYRAYTQAGREYNQASAIALDGLGLDPALAHQVNLDSGEVIPAQGATVPHEPEPTSSNGKVAEAVTPRG